ncbi:MAG: hypothetical protein ACT6FD_05910 [Methanosarcinaceae archaeon]
MCKVFLRYKRKIEVINSKTLGKKEGLTPELYLMESKNYTNSIWRHFFEKTEKILLTDFPGFLWIIRFHFKGISIVDYVYDGTSVFSREVCNIIFKY